MKDKSFWERSFTPVTREGYDALARQGGWVKAGDEDLAKNVPDAYRILGRRPQRPHSTVVNGAAPVLPDITYNPIVPPQVDHRYDPLFSIGSNFRVGPFTGSDEANKAADLRWGEISSQLSQGGKSAGQAVEDGGKKAGSALESAAKDIESAAASIRSAVSGLFQRSNGVNADVGRAVAP
jgi:hypothetical protein